MPSFVQLIDANSAFHAEALRGELKTKNVVSKGFDYGVVAIMGCQSSGKSTLMNGLFSTEFPTLDASTGRHRTTEGLCAAVSKDGPDSKDDPVIVLDLEGTDSTERGENEESFERRLALLGISLAEVLIVNIWCHDLGRRNAANYPLLRTVFELNLQLFQAANHDGQQSQMKSVLLFVVRDHVETSIDSIREKLRADIEHLWGQVSKPRSCPDAILDDFFEIDIVTLPHKVFQQEQFDEAVVALSKRFRDPSNEGYLLRADLKKNVPIDGFVDYAENNWEVILANKDLDLPAQRELLAMKRCKDISKDVLEDVKSSWNDAEDVVAIRNGTDVDVGSLVSTAESLLASALSMYDDGTVLYVSDVQASQREELSASICEQFLDVFELYISEVTNSRVESFVGEVRELLHRENGELNKHFIDRGTLLMEKYRNELELMVHTLQVSGWSEEAKAHAAKLYSTVTSAGAKEMSTEYKSCLNKISSELVAELNGDITDHVGRRVQQIINKLEPTMWDDLLTAKADAQAKVRETVEPFLGDSNAKVLLGAQFPVYDSWISGSRFLNILRERIDNITGGPSPTILTLMQQRFRQNFDRSSFTSSSGGLVGSMVGSMTGSNDPTKVEQSIRSAYANAKSEALSILNLLFYLRLSKNAMQIRLSFNVDGSSTEEIQVTYPASPSSEDTDDLVGLKYCECREFQPTNVVISAAKVFELVSSLSRFAEKELNEVYRIQALTQQNTRIPPQFLLLLLVLGFNEMYYVVTSPMLLLLIVIAVVGYVQLSLAGGFADLWKNTREKYFENNVVGQTVLLVVHGLTAALKPPAPAGKKQSESKKDR